MVGRWEAPMRSTRWSRCRRACRWRRWPSARRAPRTPHTSRPASWPSPILPSPRASSGFAASRPREPSWPSTRARERGTGVIDRYALPQMRELFGEERKLQLWLQIELLAAEALNRSGVIPDADWERIRSTVGEDSVDVTRAHEIERESQHDVL